MTGPFAYRLPTVSGEIERYKQEAFVRWQAWFNRENINARLRAGSVRTKPIRPEMQKRPWDSFWDWLDAP